MIAPLVYEPLIVEVSDRTPGIKQKARLKETRIIESPTELSVKLELEVYQYSANADGTYGNLLKGQGIVFYPVVLTADNTCAVQPDGTVCYQLLTLRAVKDMRTGSITVLQKDQTFSSFLANAPEEVLVYQGEWFAALLRAQVNVRALQEQFIMAADTPPYNKFIQTNSVDVIPMLPDLNTIDSVLAKAMAAEMKPSDVETTV